MKINKKTIPTIVIIVLLLIVTNMITFGLMYKSFLNANYNYTIHENTDIDILTIEYLKQNYVVEMYK